MELNSTIQITRARRLENSILALIVLFLFNIIFPDHDTFILSFMNEILLFLSILFAYYYMHPFLSTKSDSPLSMILNSGILGALIFFIIAVSDSIFGEVNSSTESSNLFNSLITLLVVFVFVATLVYVISVFRELFFLRQKKNPSTYFNTMLIFISLTFFSNLLLKIDTNYDYPRDAFFVVSIILICFNSIRVAWIAFLIKRQKVYLLLISVILSILFGFNVGLYGETNIIHQIILSFSPGLDVLFKLIMIYGTIYFAVVFFTTLFHLPTAEAFDRKAEEVTSLMDITKLITQVFDFKELADSITSITTKVCNSNSAWLVTLKENQYELNSVNNIGYVAAEKLSKIILSNEYRENEKVLTIYYDSVSLVIKKEMNNFRSVAIAPLKVHGLINGYLFTARQHDIYFDEDDKKSLQAFADYAAVALENAKLIAESIEKERLEKELDVARDIQRKILPSKLPEFDTIQISALFVPAFEVGGDYYDFFRLENNKLGFVVADVSGKGISASFIMAEVKGIFESLSRIIINPRDLLIKVNDILKESLDKKSFVTIVYGVIDCSNGYFNFARAGHTPLLHVSKGNVSRLQPSGIGVGLDYSQGFANTLKEMQIELKNNDIIAIYSDGIPEAKNSSDEDFGYDRFEKIILKNGEESLNHISNELMKELSLFSKDHSQHDDITLVLLKWNKNN